MARKSFSVLFFIKKGKLLKNGEAPVCMRITVNGINRKTFCDAFPNHFVSILHLLTQNELRFFIHFPESFKWFSKGT